MKKEYIKPEILVEEMLLENMLATSIPQGGVVDPYSNKRVGRRGSWGDLWYSETPTN